RLQTGCASIRQLSSGVAENRAVKDAIRFERSGGKRAEGGRSLILSRQAGASEGAQGLGPSCSGVRGSTHCFSGRGDGSGATVDRSPQSVGERGAAAFGDSNGEEVRDSNHESGGARSEDPLGI